jgi:hypothetical protein
VTGLAGVRGMAPAVPQGRPARVGLAQQVRPGAVRSGARPAGNRGVFPEQKQSLSVTARRVAARGVFPYNTAPAPPAPAFGAGTYLRYPIPKT